jgi:hypothetical protein
MKKLFVTTTNKEQYMTVLALGKSAGYTICDKDDVIKYTEEYYPRGYTNLSFFENIIVGIAPYNITQYSSNKGYTQFVLPNDFDELVNTLLSIPKSYTLEDVAGYTATVTKTGIKIGCQTVTFEKFYELLGLVEDFKYDSND